MKKISIIVSFLGMFIFLACNQIDKPLKDRPENTCGDENSPVPIKKILVEEYTGHRCPNCPPAAEVLASIHDDYCAHIIPIAIHVSIFAKPHGDDFPADYRTETGTEVDQFFGVSNQGLPGGLVNRTEYDGNLVLGKDSWRSAVNLLYNQKPEVNIIINSEYNETEKKISGVVKLEILKDINENINLGLYLTEDSIISPQQKGSEYIENYVHRHMLRKGINGPLGEKIADGVKAGDVLEKTFSLSADTAWHINHCEIIAFVSRSESNEIIQAESEHIAE